jgi:hypothetical protein
MRPRFHTGGLPMRYEIGAEQLQQALTRVHRPDTAFRVSRTAPGRPDPGGLHQDRRGRLRDHGRRVGGTGPDWEEAFFVEKCPGCFAAVLADTSDDQDRLRRRP